jgi:hypothetical protein
MASDGNRMRALKLIQIGDSVGFILPDEVVARLQAEKVDVLYLTCESHGGVTLTPLDPSDQEQLNKGREFMREFCEAFVALAK